MRGGGDDLGRVGGPLQPHVGLGEETRLWEEGRCLIFDVTVEHEAWNRSARDRLVLLFDFVRPGLGDVPLDEPPPEVQEFIRAKTGSPADDADR